MHIEKICRPKNFPVAQFCAVSVPKSFEGKRRGKTGAARKLTKLSLPVAFAAKSRNAERKWMVAGVCGLALLSILSESQASSRRVKVRRRDRLRRPIARRMPRNRTQGVTGARFDGVTRSGVFPWRFPKLNAGTKPQ